MAFTADELLTKVREFADLAIPDNEVRERYSLISNARWNLHRRRASLGGIVDGNRVKPLMFRPFDRRFIYDETNLVGDRRERLRGHLERAEGNIALVTTRWATSEAPYTFVTRALGTQALLSSRTQGAAVYVPLFLAAATGAIERLAHYPTLYGVAVTFADSSEAEAHTANLAALQKRPVIFSAASGAALSLLDPFELATSLLP